VAGTRLERFISDMRGSARVVVPLSDVTLHEPVKPVADALARFDKIRYVVVRTVDYGAPSDDGGRLRAGHVKAEALVLDRKGAGHGGLRFEATRSGSVKYTKIVDSSGHVQSDESFSAVLRDRADNAKQELKKALVAQVPGSEVHLP